MSGKLLKETHRCPTTEQEYAERGSVWQCDCGKTWYVYLTEWVESRRTGLVSSRRSYWRREGKIRRWYRESKENS